MTIDPARKYNPPKPLVWKSRNLGCDHIFSWAYKRNFKAEVHDLDGDRFRYSILEISNKDVPKIVVQMEASSFPYNIHERCEQLIRGFAKGKLPALNKLEKSLIEKGVGLYIQENASFVQYQI